MARRASDETGKALKSIYGNPAACACPAAVSSSPCKPICSILLENPSSAEGAPDEETFFGGRADLTPAAPVGTPPIGFLIISLIEGKSDITYKKSKPHLCFL